MSLVEGTDLLAFADEVNAGGQDLIRVFETREDLETRVGEGAGRHVNPCDRHRPGIDPPDKGQAGIIGAHRSEGNHHCLVAIDAVAHEPPNRGGHAGHEICRGLAFEFEGDGEGLGLAVGLGGELLDSRVDGFTARQGIESDRDSGGFLAREIADLAFGNVDQDLHPALPLEANDGLASGHGLVGLDHPIGDGAGGGRPELGVGEGKPGGFQGLLGCLDLGPTHIEGRSCVVEVRLGRVVVLVETSGPLVTLGGLNLLSAGRCELGLEVFDLDFIVPGVDPRQNLAGPNLLALAHPDFHDRAADPEGEGDPLCRLNPAGIGAGARSGGSDGDDFGRAGFGPGVVLRR